MKRKVRFVYDFGLCILAFALTVCSFPTLGEEKETTQPAKSAAKKETERGTSGYRDIPFGFHTGMAFPQDIFAHNPDDPKDMRVLITDPKEWGIYKYAQDVGAGWERHGMYAKIPPAESGLTWQELMDAVYSPIPGSMRILANIDVRSFTRTEPMKMPPELLKLGMYHPPVGTLELIDEKAYLQFVKDVVERYDGDGVNDMPGLKNPIKYWQIDNELPGAPPGDLPKPGEPFDPFRPQDEEWRKASVSNYAHILAITSEAIRASDPTAKVAMAGIPDVGAGTEGLFRRYYLEVLDKLNGKYVDIFDYHFYGLAKSTAMKDAYRMIREGLDNIGYKDMEIWIAESGTYSGRPRDIQGYAPLRTEKEQAVDLVRRFVYPLTLGVKKVFWAWGIMDCGVSEGPDGHTGLMYGGVGPDNPGYGVKKLSYYAYKKLVDVLEGSDWNNIKTEQEKDGVFVCKFTKQGKPIWVAWSDILEEKQVAISGITSSQAKITEAIPKFESGRDVIDYNTAFEAQTIPATNNTVTITLRDVPVFVEQIN